MTNGNGIPRKPYNFDAEGYGVVIRRVTRAVDCENVAATRLIVLYSSVG